MTSSPLGLHTAFFYGTLMAPSVLKRVTSHDPASTTSPLISRPALLHKHRRHRVKGADYPAVIPMSSAPSPSTEYCVRGTVVQGLTKEDIWRLDLFEGDEYERRKVHVQVLTEAGNALPDPATSAAGNELAEHSHGKEVQGDLEAETYIWIAGEHRLDDQAWDFDEFVEEKMWRWAPSEDTDSTKNDTKSEDSGFEDVRRAVEERNKEQDHDATGGRLLGGTFDDTVRHGKGGGTETQLLESAV